MILPLDLESLGGDTVLLLDLLLDSPIIDPLVELLVGPIMELLIKLQVEALVELQVQL